MPAVDEAAAASLSARLRAAVDELRREGHQVEWLRSFALVEEETYVCMLIAEREHDVASVHRRARLSCEYMAEAVPGEPAGGS